MRDSLNAVSVVVPVYNGEAYLREAVESVLEQHRADLEIIVIDDGSTDATAELIAGFGGRVRSMRQDNRGVAAARNRGIALASAPLIAFLDADDLWTEGALDRQLDCLASHPEADMIWGRTERHVMADAAESRDPWFGRPQWAMTIGSMLFRRRVLEQVNSLDETLAVGEDMDLLVRIKEEGATIVRNPEVVYRLRVHARSQFNTKPALIEEAHYRVLSKALARRRAQRQADEAGS